MNEDIFENIYLPPEEVLNFIADFDFKDDSEEEGKRMMQELELKFPDYFEEFNKNFKPQTIPTFEIKTAE